MSENLFARTKRLNQLLKDESVLYPDFLPEKLFERERETEELVFALQPAAAGGKPRNVFAFGPPGTGKTASVRVVLRQLEEYSSKARGVLVNCFECNSRHAVLSFLCEKFNVPIPKRGIGSEEIYAELVGVWKRSGAVPIVVLDEADHLLSREDGSHLLYDLLRVFEREKVRTGVFIISNDPQALLTLDDRVKSSLSAQSLGFEKYSPEQLKKILSERARLAFFPNAVSEDAVALVAGHCAKMGGDCRVGIEALLAAGRLAEKQNSEKLSAEHLKSVFREVDRVSLERRLQYLNETELGVLKSVANHPDLFSGDLFNYYSSETQKPLGERMYRNVLQKLEQMGLIESESVTEGIKGKTRKIGLVVNAEKVRAL